MGNGAESSSIREEIMHKRQYVFNLYMDKAGEHRWTFLAPNGRIIADSGEGYETRQNARRAANRLKTLLSHELDVTIQIKEVA